jgi:hypothetical protein
MQIIPIYIAAPPGNLWVASPGSCRSVPGARPMRNR